MTNPTITNNDLGSVVIDKPEFNDELLTLGAGVTVLAGTILARDSVSGKLVPFVKGGTTNEDGIPKAVQTQEVTSVAAGDYPVRPLVSGVVSASRLVIQADGDASNIDAVVTDELRDYGIVSQPVQEQNILDNQP